MNPYDRRSVRAVWARVRPDRDVFAPGPWPSPPPDQGPGQGGKPPGRPSSPSRPPAPDRPSAPSNPFPERRPPEPDISPAQRALDTLAALAAGYDGLARRYRAPALRQLAAQCRRNANALRSCAGLRPAPAGPARTDLNEQRALERRLRDHLERVEAGCARVAGNLARDSRARSRLLSRFR